MTSNTTPVSAQVVPENQKWSVILALLSVYLIWGSTYLGMHFALESFPPFVLGILRFLITVIILVVYLFVIKRQALPPMNQIRNAMIVGMLTLGVGTSSVAFAQQWVSTGISSLAVASVPLWIATFSALFFKRPTRMEWAGVLIGFTGIILLNFEKGLSAQPLGAMALILGPICWSFGSIVSRKMTLPDGLMAILFEAVGACLLMVVMTLLSGQTPKETITVNAVLAVIYLATFGSLVGFSAYMYLLKTVRPTLATSYAYVNPMVALTLGVIFANEVVTGSQLLAMAIVLVGVVIVGWAANRAKRTEVATA
jgi:drug/metabolite transporter (DMT)-like permease